MILGDKPLISEVVLSQVVKVCCLILHMALIKFLNCVVVDDHFYCGFVTVEW
jgi:hypothetical protein